MRLSLDQHQQRPKVGRGAAKWHIKKSASKPEMSPTLNVTLEQRTFSINVTKKRLADKYISGKIARVFENFGKTIFTHLFTPFQTHVPLKKTKDL